MRARNLSLCLFLLSNLFAQAEKKENTIHLHDGTLEVKVPSDWAIIGHRPVGNRTVVAFQLFDNKAEEGTEHSTNLVVTTYYLTDLETGIAFVQSLQEKPDGCVESEFQDWAINAWSAKEKGAKYQIRDARITHPDLPIGVHFRIAWPQLEGNAKDYDAQMKKLLEKLLASIVPQKKEESVGNQEKTEDAPKPEKKTPETEEKGDKTR